MKKNEKLNDGVYLYAYAVLSNSSFHFFLYIIIVLHFIVTQKNFNTEVLNRSSSRSTKCEVYARLSNRKYYILMITMPSKFSFFTFLNKESEISLKY